jgi:hypothetical protein
MGESLIDEVLKKGLSAEICDGWRFVEGGFYLWDLEFDETLAARLAWRFIQKA